MNTEVTHAECRKRHTIALFPHPKQQECTVEKGRFPQPESDYCTYPPVKPVSFVSSRGVHFSLLMRSKSSTLNHCPVHADRRPPGSPLVRSRFSFLGCKCVCFKSKRNGAKSHLQKQVLRTAVTLCLVVD